MNEQILSNLRIAEQLQKENNGQFLTLCRMHLSFEIDLELENNDPVAEKLKTKFWNKLQKRAGKFGASDSATPILNNSCITQIKNIVKFLEKEENLTQEGIFRKTGSVARQSEMKKLIMENVDLNLEKCSYTAHDCASVLKTVLAELEEPVISLNYYFAFQQVADIYNSKPDCAFRDNRLLNSLQLLLLLIPKENRTLLELIVEILNKTIKFESINKMTADSLSTLFTPHLVCPRKLNSEALYKVAKTMYSVVSFIIKTGDKIFHIPEKLATDIKAYFSEKNRRKTMSPEQILNESVASETTASTVYTFIDREKTAKATVSETTDTALAELYAYIVSLPESSRKKKLIHKFNKENGKGTPLQFLNGQRDKHSTGLLAKALGSSIKKHIFHKNFLSKTPKSNATHSQTPTKSVRVLFSETPCSPHQPNTSLILSTQELPELSVSPINQSLKHELNLTQKMSIRSISDSNLNKNIDHNFETPTKERSASVNDLYYVSDTNKNEDSSDHMFASDLNETVYNNENVETNTNAEKSDLECMVTPSTSTNKNLEEISNTPALYHLSRRLSMSPITKSTKRMPKSMQEQIMTPRSRKPITAIESLSSENKSNVFDALLEESEIDHYVQEFTNIPDDCGKYVGVPNSVVQSEFQDSLSETFKEYLLNRSLVITELPTDPDDDTSFTSHPGDFLDDMKDLSTSQMSKTMLYCLDGNMPANHDESSSSSGSMRKRTLENLKEPDSKRLYVGETSL